MSDLRDTWLPKTCPNKDKTGTKSSFWCTRHTNSSGNDKGDRLSKTESAQEQTWAVIRVKDISPASNRQNRLHEWVIGETVREVYKLCGKSRQKSRGWKGREMVGLWNSHLKTVAFFKMGKKMFWPSYFVQLHLHAVGTYGVSAFHYTIWDRVDLPISWGWVDISAGWSEKKKPTSMRNRTTDLALYSTGECTNHCTTTAYFDQATFCFVKWNISNSYVMFKIL